MLRRNSITADAPTNDDRSSLSWKMTGSSLTTRPSRRAASTISASMNQSSLVRPSRSYAARVSPFGLPLTSQMPRVPNSSRKARL